MINDRVPLWKLLLRRLRRESTSFIAGDATGSVIENVTTSAGVFIKGDSQGVTIKNVTFRSE